MPVAFYIVPIIRINPPQNGLNAHREIALNIDFPELSGQWDGLETLGNKAIVKINATTSDLLQLNAVYDRILLNQLDEPISSLSATNRTRLRTIISEMGYTLEEFNEKFPNGIANYTLKDVLKFMLTRRIKPRWDETTDEIIYDGVSVPCGNIDDLDRRIR